MSALIREWLIGKFLLWAVSLEHNRQCENIILVATKAWAIAKQKEIIR